MFENNSVVDYRVEVSKYSKCSGWEYNNQVVDRDSAQFGMLIPEMENIITREEITDGVDYMVRFVVETVDDYGCSVDACFAECWASDWYAGTAKWVWETAHKMTRSDLENMAASLYDGGWRSSDLDGIMREYDMLADQAAELCEALAEIEKDQLEETTIYVSRVDNGNSDSVRAFDTEAAAISDAEGNFYHLTDREKATHTVTVEEYTFSAPKGMDASEAFTWALNEDVLPPDPDNVITITGKWYAVMRDRNDDDWGEGSYHLSEAENMVRSLYPETGYIAVIENGVCVEEIEVDEQ